MHRDNFREDYDFKVKRQEGYNENMGKFGYSVHLPHQCDAWEIIGAEDDSEPNNGDCPSLPLSKELAVSQMELFIERAKEALEKLKALP